jgi:hypothetical protein
VGATFAHVASSTSVLLESQKAGRKTAIDRTTEPITMDRRIYAPSSGLETWRSRLADPDTQWVRGRSAFETAVFWEQGARQSRGIHPRLAALLDEEPELRNAELLASFPEHKVRLPGGARSSQNDVWAILRAPLGLVSVAVEGKAGESFAETIGEWRRDASDGKAKRLTFLCEQLGLMAPPDDALRYQLLHRTVSALVEADRIGAAAAVMVVVSFIEDQASMNDFAAFTSCLGGSVAEGRLCRLKSPSARPLFIGWLNAPLSTDSEVAQVAV